MHKRFGLGFIILFLLHATSTFALQVKRLKDNQTAFFKISAKELTRIFVEGDRIQSIRGLDGNYQLTKDNINGAVFIKPIQQKPFNLFLTTEEGHNFTLLLTPISIPAEVIQLKPLSPIKSKAEKWEKNSPYVSAIIELITGMANQSFEPEGYTVVHVNAEKPIKIPSGMSMRLETIYQGSYLQGEIWQIKNLYCRSTKIRKHEFYQRNVRAIALKDVALNNCSSTYLYRVVGR